MQWKSLACTVPNYYSWNPNSFIAFARCFIKSYICILPSYIFQGRIKLDVGGNIFTTSILTLTRESDSMLAAMFSGRHEIISEPDGCVFIDRDGTHFRHVLNYLRDGGVHMDSLPRNRQLLKELRKEAVYYQLHGLVQQIEKYLHWFVDVLSAYKVLKSTAQRSRCDFFLLKDTL